MNFLDSRKKWENINNEISNVTNKQITNILKSDAVISNSTDFVLVNVVDFSSQWQTQFDRKTTTETFYGTSGPQTVEMMAQTGKFKIGKQLMNMAQIK